ncbi:hypothetical protein [Amylolactobacillus amylophilus]|uniref:hypothetical protein n=1 Tax=Amylolactobacillus amylophilus TaxID=1603 RepID=UPI0020926096|nr:hypothetical protein [Amylolactobacillus amylophilus]
MFKLIVVGAKITPDCGTNARFASLTSAVCPINVAHSMLIVTVFTCCRACLCTVSVDELSVDVTALLFLVLAVFVGCPVFALAEVIFLPDFFCRFFLNNCKLGPCFVNLILGDKLLIGCLTSDKIDFSPGNV